MSNKTNKLRMNGKQTSEKQKIGEKKSELKSTSSCNKKKRKEKNTFSPQKKKKNNMNKDKLIISFAYKLVYNSTDFYF